MPLGDRDVFKSNGVFSNTNSESTISIPPYLKNQIDNVRRTFVSIKNGIRLYAHNEEKNPDTRFNLFFRDTFVLAPLGFKSQKALGDLVGLPKLEIKRDEIENMDVFRKKDPAQFIQDIFTIFIKRLDGRMKIIKTILTLMIFTQYGFAIENKVSLEIEQITSGPKHHLFGYIGQSLTIPWNKSGRYIVSLRTDFYKRMPVKGEMAEIILLDTRNDYKITVVDKTLAWNLQQGTMFYWNPKHPETQFFFNDIDPDTGVVFTVLYDIKKRKRIREYRFSNESIANGGVAPDGKWFAGINYGKVSRLREIISYQGTSDFTQGGIVNGDNDGLFKVNIKTGKKELLASYKTIAQFLKVKKSDTYPIYVHHTSWNRDSDRIFFVVRGDGKGKYPNVACVINVDGSNLRNCINGGHPEWYKGKLLTMAEDKKKRYNLYDVDSQKIVGRIGDNGVFPQPGGDNAYSPDGKWYVGSHRIDLKQFYTFYRFEDNAHFVSEGIPIYRGKKSASTTRIDGAPRWNRSSDTILVGGVAEDGTRQMSIIKIISPQ